MDIGSFNFEQLGTAGILVAVLGYLLYAKTQECVKWQTRVDEWTDKCFTTQQDSQKQIYEAIEMLDKLSNAIQGANNVP